MKQKFCMFIYAAGTEADMLRWPAGERNEGKRIGGLYGFDTAEIRESVKKAAERTLGSMNLGLAKRQFQTGIAHVNAAVKDNSYEIVSLHS